MNDKIISIIGAGNMGASLLGGLIATGLRPQQLRIADLDQQKLNQLHGQFHVPIEQDNSIAIKDADVLILAVKPQIIAEVAISLAETLQKTKPLVISIAAGIRIDDLQDWLGGHIAIVRCMPNTPALIQAGASALYANSFVTPEQKNLAESILRAVSLTVWLSDEKQMDAVTALSGSGPAYFFLMIEAMQKAGEKMGLPADVARLLTLQTAYGAARMALESNEVITELRRQVTSPGGTTEAAINVFENNHYRQLIEKALQAALNRSEELAEAVSKQVR